MKLAVYVVGKMQNSDKSSSKLNSASLIDLKAELFRKQQEFKAQKLQNQSAGFVKGKASTSSKERSIQKICEPSVFSKKNTGVEKRAEKDYVEKLEEDDVFERSRKALENKAKLYEKIASGSQLSEEDGSGVFLVDFQKKNIDEFEQRLERERKEKEEMERREMEEEQRQLAEPVQPAETEEEEWVDYVDAFGRSRRCLRKDLPELQKQDENLQVKKRKIDEKVERGHKDFQALRDKSTPSLLSSDMKREIEREKWEKEELEKMEEEKQGPIHYADVLHNEIRTHGVGFYKFAKDEDARKEQLDQLHKLRQETKDERSKSEKIKEKRKAALAARLAKVKQRKRAKLGLPDSPEAEEADSEEEIGPKIDEQVKKEPEPLTRDDSWRAQAELTREWDRGKEKTMERTGQTWLEKQRAERDEEFAPPSFYSDTPTAKTYSELAKSSQGNKTETESAFECSIKGKGMESEIDKQLKEIRKTSVSLNKNLSSELQDSLQAYKSSSVGSATVGENISETEKNAPFQDIPPNMSVPNYNFPPPGFNVPPPTCSIPPPGFCVPPPNSIVPPSDVYAPPPNLNVPPLNFNAPPPPNLNVPPPNFNSPPPNLNVPIQNFNVPLPNLNVPPPNYSQSNISSVNEVSQSLSVSTSGYVSYQSNVTPESTVDLCSAPQTVESHKKIVPKMSIMDTRLIANEDD